MDRKESMTVHLPAISAILARYPDEQAAAPHLRRFAVKMHLHRYRVFGAYRHLKQERHRNDSKIESNR